MAELLLTHVVTEVVVTLVVLAVSSLLRRWLPRPAPGRRPLGAVAVAA